MTHVRSDHDMKRDISIVVAITGASGSAYAIRLLQGLLKFNHTVDLVVSEAARQVMQHEIGIPFPSDTASESEWKSLIAGCLSDWNAKSWKLKPLETAQLAGSLRVHHSLDFSAGIASGSSETRGMVICPCSTGTLSAVSSGASANLIHRAADVHLKERRRLILVPRETPLSRITLTNMLTATDAGAVVLPAMPGYYHRPGDIADLIDFVVARICDQLQIKHDFSSRWGE
ncbi:MAG: UbiX family flavin prenyltransferase [Fuerstiella sp.]|nr:UbiX family flavin prenyltransferase [Fuerstiella sp.]